MIDLKIRPTLVVLVCSGCGQEWEVDETQPFVAQLRRVALAHACAPIANVTDVRDFRRTRAQSG